MFECIRNCSAGLVLAFASTTAMAASEACSPLPGGFQFCPGDSAWAGAEVVPFTNGVAFDLPPYWLEVMEPPAEIAAAPSLDAALDALTELLAQQARNEGLDAPEIVDRGAFSAGALDAVTLTTRIDLPEDEPMVFVTMIAGQGDARLFVTLDDEAEDAADTEQELRRIAALFRLMGE
ncbi:MAG: hypothetical protein JJU07_14045 [Natronohydrobacter sp.]|nr:hypothetical protein [Natronohydrobacter sp.]